MIANKSISSVQVFLPSVNNLISLERDKMNEAEEEDNEASSFVVD